MKNEMELVLPHERVDDLQLKGLKIIQDPKGFCFGIDAVLLSNFTKLKSGDTVVEFGTGTGIIPILLSGKTEFKKIYAFEVQEQMAEMATRSIQLNGLEDRIEVIHANLIDAIDYVPLGSVDVVVSNPPYMSGTGGLKNPSDLKAISRHEVLCTLEDIVEKAAKLLKFKGKFYLIHRPNRLVDIFVLCRKYKLEPKRIRMIQPFVHKSPNICLIQCVKGGNSELHVQEPLIVYEQGGTFTKEIYEIYGMENITAFTKENGEES
jgi:tRNA1Val (adenine37-N6)-methyltransferase